MSVVGVWEMGVGMAQASVKMAMDMRFASWIARSVLMLVVSVVHMGVNMLHRLMNVLVRVRFG